MVYWGWRQKAYPSDVSDDEGSINKMKHRMYWIDCSRVLAAFAVVWLHISAGFVVDHPSTASWSWWIGNVADSMSRWSVPFFVMITGYLLLSRPCDSLKEFYVRRFSRIMIPLVFWTVFYLGLDFLLGPMTIMAASKLVIAGIPYVHMWYLYMLLGLYLVAPLIMKFVVVSSRRRLLWATALCLCLGVVISYVLPAQITGTFLDLFPQFIGYFIAGYYIATVETKQIRPILLWVGFVASVLGVALLTALLMPFEAAPWDFTYRYLNPLVILMSLCLFYIVVQGLDTDSQCTPSLLMKIVSFLAPLTLGIYLVHPFFMLLIRHFLWPVSLRIPLIEIPIWTLMTFALSAVLVAIVRLIPGVRRIVV
jgi:surface polysaccharide O-acyltransferase-like enzyme